MRRGEEGHPEESSKEVLSRVHDVTCSLCSHYSCPESVSLWRDHAAIRDWMGSDKSRKAENTVVSCRRPAGERPLIVDPRSLDTK